MMWKISASSVPWLEPAVCAQASLASVRLFEGNGVSLRVRVKINDLPTAAAAVIFARSALHDLSRHSLWAALKPSMEGDRKPRLVLAGLNFLYKCLHTY